VVIITDRGYVGPKTLDGDCQALTPTMVIAKLFQLQTLFLHLQRRAEDLTEAVSRGWNRRPF